jgi:hypothetical protein
VKRSAVGLSIVAASIAGGVGVYNIMPNNSLPVAAQQSPESTAAGSDDASKTRDTAQALTDYYKSLRKPKSPTEEENRKSVGVDYTGIAGASGDYYNSSPNESNTVVYQNVIKKVGELIHAAQVIGGSVRFDGTTLQAVLDEGIVAPDNLPAGVNESVVSLVNITFQPQNNKQMVKIDGNDNAFTIGTADGTVLARMTGDGNFIVSDTIGQSDISSIMVAQAVFYTFDGTYKITSDNSTKAVSSNAVRVQFANNADPETATIAFGGGDTASDTLGRITLD